MVNSVTDEMVETAAVAIASMAGYKYVYEHHTMQARAALTAALSLRSKPSEPVAFNVDELAQEIRRVDGRHDLGAGELAEAMMAFLQSKGIKISED